MTHPHPLQTLTGQAIPPTDPNDHLASFELQALEDDAHLTEITAFASALCETPIALVSFVEKERQWFPARQGLETRETPRSASFCAHAMLEDGIMVVPDATKDQRFQSNPLVAGDPAIRFYAGAPLVSRDGVPLGALCVIDRIPRAGLTPLQTQGLTVLAQSVIALLETRRAQLTAERGVSERDQQFRLLADTMPQMVWSTLPDGFHDYYNARWYEFTGAPPGTTDGEGWNGMFHPDDQQRAWKIWKHSLATGDPYEIEYRLRSAQGDYRWVLGRALPMRDPNSEIIRWFGTCTDIHEQKMLIEQREIITHELSHRIKNIFAVIGGLVTLAAQHRPELRESAAGLRDRILALGRAHDFVRPHSEYSRPSKKQTSLQGMLDELLAPYRMEEFQRWRLSGDDPEIDDRSATPLALLFHELATNSAKYGALSRQDGWIEVDIKTSDEGKVAMVWSEHGGPVVTPPTSSGFGTRLIELSAIRQLGATVDYDWKPEGLCLSMSVPHDSMRREQQHDDPATQ